MILVKPHEVGSRNLYDPEHWVTGTVCFMGKTHAAILKGKVRSELKSKVGSELGIQYGTDRFQKTVFSGEYKP